MNEEYKPDYVTLLDEDNIEHKFEILDIIDDDRGTFYALAPYYDDADALVEDTGEYMILECIDDGESEELEMVEPDETLINQLADEFEQRFEELFEYEEDSSDD